jgi:prepilin-type N-terminal cleavage/methylation domain-containing protein/prepilin-type processing-associated H-X9-DG protein
MFRPVWSIKNLVCNSGRIFKMNTRAKRKNAFTLIELLVVIAIIALLLSITMPALNKAKEKVKSIICRSNLKQWAYVFSLYAQDNEGSFPQAFAGGANNEEDAWILGATLPYYQHLDLRVCPTTRPPLPTTIPGVTNHGDTFRQWGPFPVSLNGGNWYDNNAEGSYGFNEWLADPPLGASWWGLPQENAIRKITVSEAYNVPLVLDSVFVDTAVKHTDSPPSNIEHENDIYNAAWYSNAMKFYCIDRHNGGINGAFVDMTVRHVGLKELWRFKWHLNFITNSVPPTGWPTWMDKYKDY